MHNLLRDFLIKPISAGLLLRHFGVYPNGLFNGFFQKSALSFQFGSCIREMLNRL